MKRIACAFLLFALLTPLGCGSSSDKPASSEITADQQAAIDAQDAAVEAEESQQ